MDGKDGKQAAVMTVRDTSAEGPVTPAAPIEAKSLQVASTLEEINGKLDLLLQAQGISL